MGPAPRSTQPLVALLVFSARLARAVHRGTKEVTLQKALAYRRIWQNGTEYNQAYQHTQGTNITLRVCAPAIQAGVLFWRERADGTTDRMGEVWKGPVWDMIEAWVDAVPELTLIRQNVSDRAFTESPDPTSSWWACLNMIVHNETDLCVGDYWVSAQYRAYMDPVGTFSHSFSTVSTQSPE